MKQTLAFLLAAVSTGLLLAASYSGPARAAADAVKALDGKQIFLAQKCNLCHSVSSAGIAATTSSQKMKGPGLTELSPKPESALLADYLQKKVAIGGKKHGKQFTGSAEELAALIAWLQKQEKK